MYMWITTIILPQQFSSLPSLVTLWTMKQLIPQFANVHPHRMRILMKHLSNEPDYHIRPTHPSCPTNGHKNRGHIPASAFTTTFRPSEAVFFLLPLFVNQSVELNKKGNQRSETVFS